MTVVVIPLLQIEVAVEALVVVMVQNYAPIAKEPIIPLIHVFLSMAILLDISLKIQNPPSISQAMMSLPLLQI